MADGRTHHQAPTIVLLLCVAGAVVAVGVGGRSELPRVLRALSAAHPGWLLVAALLTAWLLLNNTLLLRSTCAAAGVRLGLRDLATGLAVGQFLNLTSNSGALPA